MENKNVLISNSDPKSPVSEAFRMLRTNILFSNIDKPVKTIVITSSLPEEGKTTITSNLALTFANNGSNVLLLDADLRRPKIHKLFGLPNNEGLSNLIVKKIDYTEYLQKCFIENLSIITAGPLPPNPAEMINSNSFRALLETLKNEFDILLIDSPPIIPVTDAAILSSLSDATIVVACAQKVETKMLKVSLELLKNVSANILGIVLNKVPFNYSYNHYYDYKEISQNI